jgi:hypothetical protein
MSGRGAFKCEAMRVAGITKRKINAESFFNIRDEFPPPRISPEKQDVPK